MNNERLYELVVIGLNAEYENACAELSKERRHNTTLFGHDRAIRIWEEACKELISNHMSKVREAREYIKLLGK